MIFTKIIYTNLKIKMYNKIKMFRTLNKPKISNSNYFYNLQTNTNNNNYKNDNYNKRNGIYYVTTNNNYFRYYIEPKVQNNKIVSDEEKHYKQNFNLKNNSNWKFEW